MCLLFSFSEARSSKRQVKRLQKQQLRLKTGFYDTTKPKTEAKEKRINEKGNCKGEKKKTGMALSSLESSPYPPDLANGTWALHPSINNREDFLSKNIAKIVCLQYLHTIFNKGNLKEK